jgi:hypothetical protein
MIRKTGHKKGLVNPALFANRDCSLFIRTPLCRHEVFQRQSFNRHCEVVMRCCKKNQILMEGPDFIIQHKTLISYICFTLSALRFQLYAFSFRL